jgi:L-seryl-tRNA(Ser) seleniumtransferase
MSTADIYARLGVRTHINAKGTYTYLTGSLMCPEASQAMEDASRHFVYLVELQQKAGAKIAQMLGVEAAMVTSGAAGASCWGRPHALQGTIRSVLRNCPTLRG